MKQSKSTILIKKNTTKSSKVSKKIIYKNKYNSQHLNYLPRKQSLTSSSLHKSKRAILYQPTIETVSQLLSSVIGSKSNPLFITHSSEIALGYGVNIQSKKFTQT